ncbi:hypothetical protein MLD38_033152 [Melastoma candidum]|uniref:Uncharacterized protein n=1 Tax=Melastoma candidum TaxID=119954 RepID=A0ACB9M5U8_9MYRT|nr:hypothetical protein MLD38_033152 [Melastoma candidum]
MSLRKPWKREEKGGKFPESFANEEGDRLAVDLQEEEEAEEEEDSAKHSYGCTFCKRRFMNAQALGGHMNIHRKDRVKGKGHLNHQNQVTVSSTNDGKRTLSYDVVNGLINPDTVGGERSYPMSQHVIASKVQRSSGDQNKIFQTLAASPTSPRHKRSFMESDFSVRIQQSLGRTDRGLLDDGLSLCVGLSASSDHKEHKISQKKSEIDLELRLGRDP